ncbi:hypothetical protein [Terrisporobacter glycolicus]|uniref:hypothetical protein n=1 Tax=Terrisporobacter glycolicus TaxID=36841 RepID=UPI003463FFDF
MTCNCNNQTKCGCDFNIRTVGVCDVSKLNFDGETRSELNWTEISIPEILCIPEVKPEIENIDQVYASLMVNCTKLIETPFAYKSYPLCYLTTAILEEILDIVDLIGTGAITAIDAAVQVIIDVLNAVIAVLQIPFPSLAAELTALINDINDALSDVTDAAQALVDVMSLGNPPANLVCAAIQTLIYALNALVLLINSVIGVINSILQQVSPALAALISAAIDGVLGVLGLTLETAVQAVITAINVILVPLLAIDCDPGFAFEIIGNAEGTCLTGRKLIIEGVLKQKIVYTAELPDQSVHSAHFEVPFIAFIIPYANFEGLTGAETLTVYDEEIDDCKEITGYRYDPTVAIVPDLNEEFEVKACIEDIYVNALEPKKVFKNVTAFFSAKPNPVVVCN